MSHKHYINVKVNELPNSEVEIEAEIPAESIEAGRTKALKELNESLNIPGFRAGHIPEKVIIEKVGEIEILERAAQNILPKITYEIIVAQKIDSIGRPAITITKIAKGQPVAFKITTALFPKITAFPDYKKIAKEIMAEKDEAITIDPKEIDALILELRKSKAYQAKLKKNQAVTADQDASVEDKDLPEFNDEFVKALGDFTGVEDFKEKVSANMTEEKKSKAKEKKRLAILDTILKDTTVGVPGILIENELDKMWAQFSDDVARMGLKTPDYLGHIKKSEDDLRKEWRTDAEKKVRLQLIMDRIASDEKIEADKELVEKEVTHLIEHYKNALPERARAYVSMVLTNEKVFQFLEGQK